MNDIIKKYCVSEHVTIKDALKQIGVAAVKMVFIVDTQDKLVGSVSDGDVRRWLLNGESLTENVSRIYNHYPKTVTEPYDVQDIKQLMLKYRIEVIPVVKNDILVDVLLWSDVFSGMAHHHEAKLNVPVLVMAGGKGTRMDPFTRILPKPLIPLGDKPIIEIILDNFSSFGCSDFLVTLNYKGKMIQSFFDSAESSYPIRFFWEEKPCGTAGGIRLAKEAIAADDFFVSNCDVLVKADYNDIYHFHTENNNDITIVGSMKHFTIPYGVLELKNGGVLQNIIEKPEYDFLVNTGMYVIRKKVIDAIPENEKFDFPQLIEKVQQLGGKVGVYPIGQHAWIDIGQWQEYHEAIKSFEK